MSTRIETNELRPNRATSYWRRLGLAGSLGLGVIVLMVVVCVGSLPWTLAEVDGSAVRRFYAGQPQAARLSPAWLAPDEQERLRLNSMVPADALGTIATRFGTDPDALIRTDDPEAQSALRAHWPERGLLGTDVLGRDLFVRCLAGGGISLGIGLAAAAISVVIGTVYGCVAGYAGGRTDAAMMRLVDILYGLPYILLVVLLAVASDAVLTEYESRGRAREAMVIDLALESVRDEATGESGPSVADARQWLDANPVEEQALRAQASVLFPARTLTSGQRMMFEVLVLLVAIGGVSWLTMARVVRGQVLSLKARPFIESARAVGVSPVRLFWVHLLPNLSAPILVYATLTVPQAILQESFLSFLGIGVKPPVPSWGNLVADGLGELNTVRSHWWLLLFPSLLLGVTLLGLNFAGEALREAIDPRSVRRKP